MKKVIALLLALSMLFTLAACGSSASNTNTANAPANEEPVKDNLVEQKDQAALSDTANISNGTIRDKIVMVDKTSQSLAPWGTRNDVPGNYEVYEMLYECNTKGEVFPILADATYEGTWWPCMDHEKGAETYTVHIYDYIYDHNGNHVTAADVAWSFMYQFQNESTSGWGDLVNVEAVDDTTVLFTFTREQNNLGQLANILCRQFVVSEKSYNESASGLVNEMIGTGPYKCSDYVSGASLTLVKNENYWQTNDELRDQTAEANVNTIVYEYITETAQKVIGLETGSIDMVTDLGFEDAQEFADGGAYDDNYNVFTYLQKFVYYMDPNCSPASPCGDENLRLAIMNAVDVDGLVLALGGTMTKLPAYVSSYYSDYDMVDWASLDNYNTKTSANAELVKSYLDASNYKGETLRIITAGCEDAATVISAQLAQYGINCSVQALDFSTANATQADETAWDLNVGMMAGDYIVQVWEHDFSYANTATGDHTMNFVVDDEWDAMLKTVLTEDGHTSENMLAWWNHAVEHGYTIGLYTGMSYNIVPADMTYVQQGDKLVFLPGGCTYEAR